MEIPNEILRDILWTYDFVFLSLECRALQWFAVEWTTDTDTEGLEAVKGFLSRVVGIRAGLSGEVWLPGGTTSDWEFLQEVGLVPREYPQMDYL
ncbi:hypothetical protein PQX77_015730, partial [Marasmius sp. AFHP31]